MRCWRPGRRRCPPRKDTESAPRAAPACEACEALGSLSHPPRPGAAAGQGCHRRASPQIPRDWPQRSLRVFEREEGGAAQGQDRTCVRRRSPVGTAASSRASRAAGLIAELEANCLPPGYSPVKKPSTLPRKYTHRYIIIC